MDGKFELRCPKCGKLLNGVSFGYGHEWLCSECAEDKADVLHCERGCKVRAVDLDAGMPGDSKKAKELLVEGQVYEVESLEVGSWISNLCLKEFPGVRFNTVQFERCE